MANTSTTEIASGVNNFYVRTMLMRGIPNFLYTRFAQVKDIPKGNSETVKFRRYSSLDAATTALTEGVTPTGSQLSKTDVTATVAYYGDFVTLTDFLTITTLDPLATETSEVLGEQASDSLDQIARDVITAGSTVQYASTATGTATVAAGMNLNFDEVREAVRTLKGNNAKKITRQLNPSQGFNTSPIRAAYVGIISEDTEHDLKDDPEFVPVEEYSQQADVMDGEIGKIDEVRFLSATSNAKVASSSGADSIDVHKTVILGREAYATTRISGAALQIINKPLGSGGTTDPLNQRGTMGWKATFVVVILNDNFLIRIEHAVSS